MKKILIASVSIVCVILLCSCSVFGFGKELESVKLSSNAVNLTVGDKTELTVTYVPSDMFTENPEWTSSDSSVVRVDDGNIKAVSAGTAVITVSANGISDKCTVTVSEKKIEKITLNVDNTIIKAGKTVQLEFSCTPADAPSDSVQWSSSAPKIAEVNSNGYVKGISPGTAEIICSVGEISAVCKITVKENIQTTTSSTETVPTEAVSTSPSASQRTTVATDNSNDDFIFPNSSVKQLTIAEVSGISSDEAQDAINEIYARNGYVFKTDSIQRYYESKSWYNADSSFTMNDLNAIENYNIALLSQYR